MWFCHGGQWSSGCDTHLDNERPGFDSPLRNRFFSDRRNPLLVVSFSSEVRSNELENIGEHICNATDSLSAVTPCSCVYTSYYLQIGNTLRLSFQCESSVSGTELRLPSACVLLFIMCIRQKWATIMHIRNNNVYSRIHIIIENMHYYTCCTY